MLRKIEEDMMLQIMQQEGDYDGIRDSLTQEAHNPMIESQRTHITELTAENDGIDAEELVENDLNDFITNAGNMDFDREKSENDEEERSYESRRSEASQFRGSEYH